MEYQPIEKAIKDAVRFFERQKKCDF